MFLESRRTNPAELSQGVLLGMWQMHPWFEQMCPAGHFITALGVSADGVITGLSAVCDDGTQLSLMPGAADMLSPSTTSATGFLGVRTRRTDAGVCSMQYVLSNGSETEMLGTPADAFADMTDVDLLCAADGSERLLGFYGRSTLQSKRRVLGALGVVCGRKGKA